MKHSDRGYLVKKVMRFVRKLETEISLDPVVVRLVSYLSSWSSLHIKGPKYSQSSNPYPSQYLIIWHHIATVPSAVHLLQISTIVSSPVSLAFKLYLSESEMTEIVCTLGHVYLKLKKN